MWHAIVRYENRVELPTKFERDQSLFARADEMIQYVDFAAPHNVRFWHKADIPRLSSDVRFWG
jgi:hypothetical protein